MSPSAVSAPSRDEVFDAVLSEYRAVTRERLFRYLPDAEPRDYLYTLAADYPRRGGRGFRPSLCIATARAFGASTEAALATAVSIEMIHNAMLIHDDIEDESEHRRGRAALHVTEGVPIAINVGDALSLLAMRPLLDNRPLLGPELSLRILEETERMARESAEGQALELGWRRDNVVDLTESDYLTMVLKKTCWLATIHPMRAGALIGSRGRVDPDRFLRFGFLLGAAFQVQDDLLNLEGDPDAYGKEMDGDILEGKRTPMLLHRSEHASARATAALHPRPRLPPPARTEDDVSTVRTLMDRYGSIDYARQAAHGLAGAAQYEFLQSCGDLPDSRDRRFIAALPEWFIHRS